MGQCSFRRAQHPLVEVSEHDIWGKIIAVSLGNTFGTLEKKIADRQTARDLQQLQQEIHQANKKLNKKTHSLIQRMYEEVWLLYKNPEFKHLPREEQDRIKASVFGKERSNSSLHLDSEGRGRSPSRADLGPDSGRLAYGAGLSDSDNFGASETPRARARSSSSGAIDEMKYMTLDELTEVIRAGLEAQVRHLPPLLRHIENRVLAVLPEGSERTKVQSKIDSSLEEVIRMLSSIANNYAKTTEAVWHKTTFNTPRKRLHRDDFVKFCHSLAFELLDPDALLEHLFRFTRD